MSPSGDELRLREGYRRCASLTRRYGTTYFWGAAMLPRPQRKHVYAVYALCRLADDIVDDPQTGTVADPVAAGARLHDFVERFGRDLAAGGSEDPVLSAVVHTARTAEIDPECFDRFFAAMAMDLTQSTYPTWGDLLGYMEGSAAVIGEMMLPVLQPLDPAAKAPARSLGLAFQLTNFLRDIREDLDRGRTYVPQEDLDAFGVDLRVRRPTPEFKALMAHEIERNRALYAFADTGIAMLPARSARCVGAARVLYARILDRIEAAEMNIWTRRARVPTVRKAATAAAIMIAGPGRQLAKATRPRQGEPQSVTSDSH
ncbi:phytoene/squalene synthase family protein [Microlunatus ginsengisoli]|uniref:Phytoene/squalene synthase family protein n=1 Tax=Microlunatus ginsengisoli TaxID=363863 RepID=A0ABP6ZG64_9ACTN